MISLGFEVVCGVLWCGLWCFVVVCGVLWCLVPPVEKITLLENVLGYILVTITHAQLD